MTHFDLVAFGSWSAVTAIFIIVIGLVYKQFTKRKKDESYQT
ncbi:MAG: hypothetical protein ACREAN_06075 [Nitrosopumilaceae archaeon]